MTEPKDETRKRFEELLAAKKKAQQQPTGPGDRPDRPTRPQPAKGSRGFTRRKV